MFENPRRGRQAKNFKTNVSKILDLKSSSEQIFSENLLSIARKKPQKSLSGRVSEISTFWQRIYFMQFLSCDVCVGSEHGDHAE